MEYTVRSGDSLTKIARKFGIDSWRKIWNANRETIPNPNLIEPGQKIKIPTKEPASGETISLCKVPEGLKERLETFLFMFRHVGFLNYTTIRYPENIQELRKKIVPKARNAFVLELKNKGCPDSFINSWMKKTGKSMSPNLFAEPKDLKPYFDPNNNNPDYKPGDSIIFGSYNTISYIFNEIGINNLQNMDIPEQKEFVDFIYARRKFFIEMDEKFFNKQFLRKIPKIDPKVRGTLRKEAENQQKTLARLKIEFENTKKMNPGREKDFAQADIRTKAKETNNWRKKYEQVYTGTGALPHYLKSNVQESNKIIQEYILKNTPQPPKEVSVIEIIADEVNQALNNHPEIQLAGQVLNEDELKELFSPLAKQIVTNVYGQMEENIKNLVEAQIDDALLAKVVSKLENNEDDEELTDEEMMSIKNSLPSDVLSVDPQKIQNIAEQEE